MEKKIKIDDNRKMPTWIKELKYEAKKYAKHYGLDTSEEIIFEVLEFDELNKIASKGGFPRRYPHWRFGMEYEELSKGYAYGLQKIYEMVINTSPCFAYLLKSNNPVDQKIVIAHVYAHFDFFKQNFWFKALKSAKNMLDETANHAMVIERIIEKQGKKEVREWIDICLSLEYAIDINSLGIKRKKEETKKSNEEKQEEENNEPLKFMQGEKYKPYMDSFLNPETELEKERQKIKQEKENQIKINLGNKIPETPQLDILQFLIENAPIEKWKRTILEIIREESYYFAPQGQTKIMNEGWASYWHSTICTKRDEFVRPFLTDKEIIDYADHHSGTLQTGPSRINPYKLGKELFEYIEFRWNTGRFGHEWEDCLKNGTYEDQKKFDKKLGLGREKIFEVRKIYNDIGFIDGFLDPFFCKEQKMFAYKYDKEKNWYEIASRDFEQIKKTLLFSLTNFGRPFIYVVDGNYGNKKEIYCYHDYNGVDVDLDLKYAKRVLENMFIISGRPVHLETKMEDKIKLFTFDGQSKETDINSSFSW